MDKADLRQLMRAKRDQIPAPIIYKACQAIYERVVAWSVFQAAQCVACYVSVQNEVDTRRFIEYALGVGKQVCVPVTQGRGVMGFQEILSLDNLQSARFGLLEPERDVGLMVEPDDLDLVIVPGVAFDRRGNRLGFGGGYYDRFFERCNATRVGLAYAFQVVDDIPAEDHDVKIDWLVTEDEVILCQKET
jgi:5-formyltetrahydrofolate cyclo-ligase